MGWSPNLFEFECLCADKLKLQYMQAAYMLEELIVIQHASERKLGWEQVLRRRSVTVLTPEYSKKSEIEHKAIRRTHLKRK